MNKFKPVGKSITLDNVGFAEPVTFRGGKPTSRVDTRMYGKKRQPDPAGGPLPKGTLYDR